MDPTLGKYLKYFKCQKYVKLVIAKIVRRCDNLESKINVNERNYKAISGVIQELKVLLWSSRENSRSDMSALFSIGSC